jgi:hypothetical protein
MLALTTKSGPAWAGPHSPPPSRDFGEPSKTWRKHDAPPNPAKRLGGAFAKPTATRGAVPPHRFRTRSPAQS